MSVENSIQKTLLLDSILALSRYLNSPTTLERVKGTKRM